MHQSVECHVIVAKLLARWVSKPSFFFLTFLPKTNQRQSWFAPKFFQAANYDCLNQKFLQGGPGGAVFSKSAPLAAGGKKLKFN
jgi:hypothetical protein